MSEPRDRQIVINLEESFYDVFMALAVKEGCSGSALGRRMVLKHLIEIGVLPRDHVLEKLI